MNQTAPLQMRFTRGYIGLECQECGDRCEMTNNTHSRQYVGRGRATTRECWGCKRNTKHTIYRP